MNLRNKHPFGLNRRDVLRVLHACGVGSVMGSGVTAVHAATGAIHQPVGALRTNWSADPFARGSYSYLANGSDRRDRLALERPIGSTIYFAGEASYPDYNSTVHAAYESGVRTADMILDSGYEQPNRTVAIIGAGISGLACAKTLADAGLHAQLFEARTRTGGRVWSDDTLGLPLDLGASWIHGVSDNPLTAMADGLDLPRERTGPSYILRGANGRAMRERDAPDWLEDVIEIEHLYGAARDQINWAAYRGEDDYDGGDVTFPGGYSAILAALAGDYTIHLNHEVLEVRHDEERAHIRFKTQGDQAFGVVVVTVPLGVLKAQTLAFDPPLPAAKQQAIDRLGMGVLDKVYLMFDEVFWDADIPWLITPDTGLTPGHFNQWFNLFPSTGQAVLCAFNGGDAARALAELPDETVIGQAMDVINAAYNANL